MRVTLIHNPDAGAGGPSKDALLSAIAEAGHDVVYRSADAPATMAALDDPGFAGELVVVAGGDGTVGKIAKRLAGRRIPIAVLPVGTANNIATALGAGGDLAVQVVRWASASRRPFDVGLAAGPWGRVHFLESVGGGLFARTMAALGQRAERGNKPQFPTPEEELAHAVHELREELRRAEARDWRVILDGEDHSGRYLLVEAMNIPYVGPNLALAAAADFGDGLLDVALLDEAGRGRFDDYLGRRLSGDHAPPDLVVRRARQVTFEPHGEPAIHIDDDGAWPALHQGQRPSGPIHLSVERHALTFLVP